MGRPKNRVVRVCQYCGKEFETFPSEVKKGHGKFCSRTCSMRYRNTHDNPAWIEDVRAKISANHADVSGNKNPMFCRKGDAAPSYIDGRNSFKGEPYRRILLASGIECKCVMCGTVERLSVHHIDGNHKNNDIKNLVWLCYSCHNNIAHNYERDSQGRFLGSTINTLEK